VTVVGSSVLRIEELENQSLRTAVAAGGGEEKARKCRARQAILNCHQ